MKTINKIILGLVLLSGSLIADEIKLAWKGCSQNVLYHILTMNVIPEVRDNTNQQVILLGSTTLTRDKPLIIDSTIYNSTKKLYNEIYSSMVSNTFFTEFLKEFFNKTLSEQNELLDEIVVTMVTMDCMEVIE